MTPRRVLMTADAVGGVWTYALDLAGALAARGVRTLLAVPGPPPDAAQRAQALAVPGLVLRLMEAPLDWLADSPDGVRGAGASIAALAQREGDIDLVHLNSPALAAGVQFPAPVLANCHSCVATWWRVVRGGPMPADFRWRAALVAEGLRAAQARIAPTGDFARIVRDTYDLREVPRTVRNGRRLPAAAAAEPPADYAFTAGRLWDAGKDLATVDAAAARLAVPVVAAGPTVGPHGEAITLPRLRLVGTLTPAGIDAHLARRPVFVSAARYEPFGLAVLEAAAAGCALVLADTPVFRELWDGAAAFFPAGDDAALAGRVAALMADPAARD
ncbi:MAG: glycosyltransferase, partial [Acetobacteraceae bacterium]|nr:glycosyltransferase [Acetobacteraceae bacterium]